MWKGHENVDKIYLKLKLNETSTSKRKKKEWKQVEDSIMNFY